MVTSRSTLRVRHEFSRVGLLTPFKHPSVPFLQASSGRRVGFGQGKPQTFNFLGFTFICGRSQRGAFLLRRQTRCDRMSAALREIKDEMRRRRYDPHTPPAHPTRTCHPWLAILDV